MKSNSIGQLWNHHSNFEMKKGQLWFNSKT
ncbi:unnamed protein product, partial [Vitis vinifera]|uniref:Uncharacterized protein n=1 Tax=Vitis vinifera TaxID=29760 RepID=D7U875_VITVI